MPLANTPNLQGERARFPMLPWTPGNLPTHRPLAHRVSRANLEMVEPLARVGMRKGNAAAPG